MFAATKQNKTMLNLAVVYEEKLLTAILKKALNLSTMFGKNLEIHASRMAENHGWRKFVNLYISDGLKNFICPP